MKEEFKKRSQDEVYGVTTKSNNKSLDDIFGIKVIEAQVYEDDEPERVYYNNPNKKENDKISIGTYDEGELLDCVYLFDKKNVNKFQKAIDYAHENEEDKEYMSFSELIEEYLDMNQIPYEVIGINKYYCIGDEDTF